MAFSINGGRAPGDIHGSCIDITGISGVQKINRYKGVGLEMKNKLAILGGGLAGLKSALTGLEKGFDITLFEKKRIGENYCCAEGFFDSFKVFSPPVEGICFKVKNIIIKVNNTYELDSTGLNFWMMDRENWQKHLADVCADKGVDIKENTKVSSEDLSRFKQEFDWVIDATGVASLTRKYYNYMNYKNNFGRAYQLTLNGDFSFLNEKILVGTEPHYLGYYWIFPKGRDIANVGLGVFNSKEINLARELSRILDKENMIHYKILKKGGGLIPTQVSDRLVYDNVILVGDSAGLASPLHGGGIELALLSGKIAIESIRDQLDYKKNLMKKIGRKLELENKLINIWSELGHDGLDELLDLLLNRKSLINIPKLLKYKKTISSHKNDLNEFYKCFFEGYETTK